MFESVALMNGAGIDSALECRMPKRSLRLLTMSFTVILGIITTLGAGTANAAVTLDQGNSFDLTPSIFSVSSGQSLSQEFTAGLSGPLTKVSLGLQKNNTVTNLTVGIYVAAAGIPTGSALASTTLTGAQLNVVPTSQAIFDVEFGSPAYVNSGSTYAIVATSTDSTGFYSWYLGTTYPGGVSATRLSGPWGTNAFVFTFQTYVDVPYADMPAPVQQQFGKPAAGTCDAAAPATLNWSSVASGGWSESWAQWMNGGNGGAVCARTLAYCTSLGKWVVS